MNKIVIAITGASGSVYAKLLLEKLFSIRNQFSDVAVVITENAKKIWQMEISDSSYKDFSFTYYRNNDFTAPFASGSAQYNIMLVVPCSMGMIGRIANGISNDLISRAADVILKERRKLICVPREAPYSIVHIENMKKITEAGGIICPASPSFYHHPSDIEALTATVINRVLDLADLKISSNRWGDN